MTVSPVERCARLLRALLRRDAAGHPVPTALAELGTGHDDRRLRRDLADIVKAGWVVHRQGNPAYVWAERPSEAVIV